MHSPSIRCFLFPAGNLEGFSEDSLTYFAAYFHQPNPQATLVRHLVPFIFFVSNKLYHIGYSMHYGYQTTRFTNHRRFLKKYTWSDCAFVFLLFSWKCTSNDFVFWFSWKNTSNDFVFFISMENVHRTISYFYFH